MATSKPRFQGDHCLWHKGPELGWHPVTSAADVETLERVALTLGLPGEVMVLPKGQLPWERS
jgi:hypothetical protein